jgi:hypothetical protein
MSLRPASVRSATQYKQIRSLIQTEAQTYKILPLIPNPTSAFLVQHANGDVHKIVIRGLVIKVAKNWLEQALTMIVVEA